MTDPDLLVIGGGPAGIAAAVRAADAGASVVLAEMRPALGGAFHRRPIEGVEPWPIGREGERRWARLDEGLVRTGIVPRLRTAFLGLDGAGAALLEDRVAGRVETCRPRAIILATGALESVRPRPGWHLPGVVTAGGLQVMMKETGRIPEGRILLAGSGPLLIALAGQLTAHGRPPVAVVEAADPFTKMVAGLGLLAHPRHLAEAAVHLGRLALARVPWRRATVLETITPKGDAFEVTLRDRRGRRTTLEVDHVALHDGIRPNDHGLPAANETPGAGPIVVAAGDGREVLGVVAAEIDGERAADRALALIGRRPEASRDHTRRLARERHAQAVLARVFAPARPLDPLETLPDDTVLCRCEGRTIGDLKALFAGADTPAGREIKLTGRFAMGLCQGRFCAHWVAEASARLGPGAPAPRPRDLTGDRWPARPVPIAALAAVPDAPKR